MLEALNSVEDRRVTVNILSTIQGDSDCFAWQIWNVLNQAGLNPKHSLCLAEYPNGVSINPKDETSALIVNRLIAAFKATGIDLPIFTLLSGQGSDFGIDIMVGAKPLE
jgi:hypothetical protein